MTTSEAVPDPRDTKTPIRVFLVDDSPLALVMLKRMIATARDIEVVGTARSGQEALAQFQRTQPHVICTDYHMPDMDGLALIQQTMEIFPRPILVISSTIDPAERYKTMPLLAAGAVDVFPKPTASTPFEQAAAELVQKIRLLSGIRVISRRAPKSAPSDTASTNTATFTAASPPVLASRLSDDARKSEVTTETIETTARGKSPLIRVVAIGASTGGPEVLQTIFRSLPAEFPCPILCVQHISSGFLSGLVEWLDSQSRLRVKIAASGETPLPGTVYFPQEESHLEVNDDKRLVCSQKPPVGGHKPSITVTFEACARQYRHGTLGVLLTGMGSDGAAGLEAIHQKGGITIAQDQASSIVFGMPKQAIALGVAQFILPPDEITRSLIRLTTNVV